MLIQSLTIHNILSIENAQVDFGTSGMVLLDGFNYDDNSANGAGKTAVFNSLSFGLYGKMPRDITSSEYLRKGTKTGHVQVEVDCDGEIWSVYRARPTELIFQKNGQIENITQEEFEKKLGLSYSQFLMTIYASQLKTDKFILLNDSGKKDFLLQLLNLEKFGIAKSAAAQSIKDILTKIAANELQITSTASKIQTSQGFLVDDAEVQQQLIQCDTSTVETQIEVLSQIQKPDLSKYQTIEDGIAKKQAEFHEIRAQHRQARQTWTGHYSSRKIQKEIATLDCPHCSEKLVMGSNVLLKATDIVAQQKHIQEHNAQIEEKMAAATIEIEELQAKLDGEVKITELANKIKAKRQEDSEEYHQAISRISELRSQKTRLEVTAASWKNKLKESKALQVKIEVYEKDLVALKANADKLRSEQTMAETLAHLFSPTGVSAYIFDMVIDMLNGRVTEYIETLWPNASYQLLSFKETKAGETRAKFSEKIILGGKERSLGSLSGGELRCLSLAVDLAVIDVVCKISGIQLNPLILDEAFDGMDNANRERAMDLVSKLSINKEIWIIDHSSEVCSMFSKTVRAEKRNEVTVLV